MFVFAGVCIQCMGLQKDWALGPKITNPLNNRDWPRHKACANISGSVYIRRLRTLLVSEKSGRQRLCPRETKWEIITTSGQLWVDKMKELHIYEQLHTNPTDVEKKSEGQMLHLSVNDESTYLLKFTPWITFKKS